MMQKIQGQMSGRYHLSVVSPDGSRRVVADWFDNLITDAGLNRIGTGGVINNCQVGSGSTPPAFSDTALETRIGAAGNVVGSTTGNASASPYYGWNRMSFRFNAGIAAGNVSEIGVGWGATGNLFSRALIRDSNGDPTTITVLSDEVLDVVYELRLYPPEDDVVFQTVIGGVTHDCVLRASSVNQNPWHGTFLPPYGATQSAIGVSAHGGPLGAVTAAPSGASSGAGATVMDPYSNNSLEISGTVTFALNAGNIAGGIGAISIRTPYLGDFQCSFDPKIQKDATKVLTLDVGMSWARKAI